MSKERRYQDKEVAAIFEAAAGAIPARRRESFADGLTLDELREIGAEVGIPPDRIAEAAFDLDREGISVHATTMRMPVAVRRTIPLPRSITDQEWEILLAELRATFEARGKDRSAAGIRQWANGNLHAFVEPTATGQRLRLGTRKGDAVPINLLGVGGILMGSFLLGSSILVEAGASDVPTAIAMLTVGGGALAANAVRLRKWARERSEQMVYIAARAKDLVRPSEPGREGDSPG